MVPGARAGPDGGGVELRHRAEPAPGRALPQRGAPQRRVQGLRGGALLQDLPDEGGGRPHGEEPSGPARLAAPGASAEPAGGALRGHGARGERVHAAGGAGGRARRVARLRDVQPAGGALRAPLRGPGPARGWVDQRQLLDRRFPRARERGSLQDER
eukprot:660461-Lingulodinium_polyedra.AAC.1